MQKLCIQLFFVLLLLAGVDGASYISESYMNSKIIRSSINNKNMRIFSFRSDKNFVFFFNLVFFLFFD